MTPTASHAQPSICSYIHPCQSFPRHDVIYNTRETFGRHLRLDLQPPLSSLPFSSSLSLPPRNVLTRFPKSKKPLPKLELGFNTFKSEVKFPRTFSQPLILLNLIEVVWPIITSYTFVTPHHFLVM